MSWNLKVAGCEERSFVNKDTIETIDAGDTFGACVLYHMIEHGLDNLDEDNLRQMLTFANAATSIITTRKGALKVILSREEVEKLLRS